MSGSGTGGSGVPGFGVYVHVPFCTRRCDYCAFATWTDRFSVAGDYVEACITEIRRASDAEDLPPATSVFFGGGTPSLLPAEQIGSILDAVHLAPGAEITVECNPETVDEAKLAGYRSVGVNRLSFGVQSMAPHVLESLGRQHSVGAVRAAAEAAGATGFEGRFNVDLILGAVGESLRDWEETLSAVLSLDPPPAHISAYALTVEPGTPLAADTSRHPDSDDQADKYLAAESILSSAGFGWYEISNWAKQGQECRHNLLYWRQGDYRGIGCAAHSHRADPGGGGARRWWNVRTPERYIRLVAEQRSTEASGENLGAEERRVESLQLALRTRDGVPEGALDDAGSLEGLVEPGSPGMVRLTARGRLLANEVAMRLRAAPVG